MQAQCEAKNHALVLEDCDLESTVNAIINSTYGCAGMRGGYHATALAGSDMSFSLSAGILTALGKETEFVEHFEEPVAAETIERLNTIPEFVRAYNVEAMPEAEYILYGASQRTLSLFVEAGWNMIAEFPL